jgi:hypothetical protein
MRAGPRNKLAVIVMVVTVRSIEGRRDTKDKHVAALDDDLRHDQANQSRLDASLQNLAESALQWIQWLIHRPDRCRPPGVLFNAVDEISAIGIRQSADVFQELLIASILDGRWRALEFQRLGFRPVFLADPAQVPFIDRTRIPC